MLTRYHWWRWHSWTLFLDTTRSKLRLRFSRLTCYSCPCHFLGLTTTGHIFHFFSFCFRVCKTKPLHSMFYTFQ
uniref:Uncharacterized protein n=1 Tax=Panstrongylus lignarius TaxID=156445 RepID=A0A224XTR0_9HEMI